MHVNWRDIWLVLRTIEQGFILRNSFASHSRSMARETFVVHHHHQDSAHLLWHSGYYPSVMRPNTKALGYDIIGEVLG
jgi:hypothetical protein